MSGHRCPPGQHIGPLELRRRRDGKARKQCARCLRGVGRSMPIEQLSESAQRTLGFWLSPAPGEGNGTARRRAYRRYITSPEWRERRERIIARDGGVAQCCGEDDPSKLSVHHKRYPKLLGTEPDEDLVTWCVDCNLAERTERLLGAAR